MFFPGAPFSRPPREGRKAGGGAELGHLSARALIGFGLRMVAIGTGARAGASLEVFCASKGEERGAIFGRRGHAFR